MTLKELNATFIKIIELKPHTIYHTVDSLNEADGLLFLCPKCFIKNSGKVGTHSVLCWFMGKVPDDLDPKPGRWTPEGTNLDNLSFVPGSGKSHSVLLLSGCNWHGLITSGQVT